MCISQSTPLLDLACYKNKVSNFCYCKGIIPFLLSFHLQQPPNKRKKHRLAPLTFQTLTSLCLKRCTVSSSLRRLIHNKHEYFINFIQEVINEVYKIFTKFVNIHHNPCTILLITTENEQVVKELSVL